MSKKADKLREKYLSKLDSELWLREKGIISQSDYCEAVSKVEDEFNSLIYSMYLYELLSLKDFNELSDIKLKLYFEYLEK